MDHPHGHPQKPSLSDSPSPQSVHSQGRHSLHTPSPQQLRPQRSESTLSLPPQRRLQLRNAGFRAPQLSAHKIGARLSRIFNGNDDTRPPPSVVKNEENKPPSNRSIRGLRSNHRSNTSLGILHEITNSTRNLQSDKSRVPVFEDNLEQPLLTDSPASPGSLYHDASSAQVSPLQVTPARNTTYKMRLREVSGNERRSPPPNYSSPLSASYKGRRKRSPVTRKSNFESIEYIEHIEKELDRVKEMMHSPKSGRPIVEKLKEARLANKQLKKTIEDLEDSFDERLKEAVDHMNSMQVDLRRTIKRLEDELEEKDFALRDIEYQHGESRLDQSIIETLKTTIAKLELENQGLQDTNRSISKRNEVLTELLAISPTKSHSGIDMISPVREGRRRTPRPRSMMIPTLPSSPSTRHSSRTQSVAFSPAFSASYFSPRRRAIEEDGDSGSDVEYKEPESSGEDSQSLDSGLGESCSMRSLTRGNSRRSDSASQGSISPSSWGLPLPPSPSDEKGTIRPTRRKPRRFMSGSTQLKPLLLSTITTESCMMQNPSLIPSPLSPRRDISDASIDPTISFISQPCEDFFQSMKSPDFVLTEEPESIDRVDTVQTPDLDESIPEWATGLNIPGLSSPPIENGQQHQRLAYELQLPSDGVDFDHEEDITAILNPGNIENSEIAESGTVANVSSATSEGSVVEEGCMNEKDELEWNLSPPRHQSITGKVVELSSSLRNEHMQEEQPIENQQATLTVEVQRLEMATGEEIVQQRASDLQMPYITRKRRISSPSPDYLNLIPQHPPALPPSQFISTPTRKLLTPSSIASKQTTPKSPISSPNSSTQSSIRSKLNVRPRSPLEILQQRAAGHLPLASVTIQTIYGTLSRYTTLMRDIKRDPTALARRVIANAWRSNWKKFGKLSWWVLGLFLGSGARKDRVRLAEARSWDWDEYDGEGIAASALAAESGNENDRASLSHQNVQASMAPKKVRFDEEMEAYRTTGRKSPARPVLKKDQPDKMSWGESLYLWGKFSVAILLAVGGAVVKGPGEMLKECDRDEPVKRKSKSTIGVNASNCRSHPAPSELIESSSKHLNSWMDFDADPHFLDDGEYKGDDDPGPAVLSEEPRLQSIPLSNSASTGFTKAPSPSRHPQHLNLQDSIFAFGSPSQYGPSYMFDDDGSLRCFQPEYHAQSTYRSEAFIIANSPGRNGANSIDPRSPDIGHGKRYGDRIGSLNWIQDLSVEDLCLDHRDVVNNDDGSSTLRASKRRVGDVRDVANVLN